MVVPVLLSGGLTLVACSIEDDYETLSFWFDGVPTPEHLRVAEGPEATGGTESGTEAGVSNLVQQERDWGRPPEGFSRHAPYEDKDCMACHVADLANARGFSMRNLELRMGRDKLCVSCHEPEVDTYVHGPSASGNCYICHEPHHSYNPSLLREAEQRELCLQCHSGPLFVTREEHEAYQDQDCTACHDPHASAHPALLREAPE